MSCEENVSCEPLVFNSAAPTQMEAEVYAKKLCMTATESSLMCCKVYEFLNIVNDFEVPLGKVQIDQLIDKIAIF